MAISRPMGVAVMVAAHVLRTHVVVVGLGGGFAPPSRLYATLAVAPTAAIVAPRGPGNTATHRIPFRRAATRVHRRPGSLPNA
jgi:hypothetical protein